MTTTATTKIIENLQDRVHPVNLNVVLSGIPKDLVPNAMDDLNFLIKQYVINTTKIQNFTLYSLNPFVDYQQLLKDN